MSHALSATIYRSPHGDCTGGGISSPSNAPRNRIIVAGPGIRQGNYDIADAVGVAVPWYGAWKIVPATRLTSSIALMEHIAKTGPGTRDYDGVMVWQRWAKRVDLLAQLPAQETGGVGPMMGGNFALGDGRWSEAFGSLPLPIHDRIETAERYRLLSSD